MVAECKVKRETIRTFRKRRRNLWKRKLMSLKQTETYTEA